jgi:predicted transcriptional regulator
MNLLELLNRPELSITALTEPSSAPIEGGCVCDLLSEVLAAARPGNIWVTLQTNRNVGVVANLQGLSAVIIAGGRAAQEGLLDLARDERVNLLTTPLSAFQIAGMLYELGIR